MAALLVRWDYTEVLAKFDPGHTIKSQGVFSTLPGNGSRPVSDWGGFRDQIIGTAILLFVIVAITDLRNNLAAGDLTPIAIGFLVVAIGMAWGTDAGYAINPARDFGPRLASFLTGYGTAFHDQYGSLYFWVPIVGADHRRARRCRALRTADRPVPADRRPEEPGRVPTSPEKFESV